MSFYLLVDAKFVVKRDFMSRIIEVLKAYKVIIENGGSADDIDMIISNWSPITSTASLVLPKLTSLRNPFGSIITFKHEYTKYITTNCMILVQNLIEMYTIDVSIAKLALQNLLSLTVLQSEMDSVSVMQLSRVRYAKRISNISSFLSDEICDIVYRELLFAYLSKKRDDELLRSSKDLLIDLSYSSILEFQSTVTNEKFTPSFLWSNIDNLVFDEHIRNLEDINSLRVVNKELNEHFSFDKIKSIVTENLMNIIDNFFLLNSYEFSKLIAKIGAIISGSAIEQSCRGGASKFRDDSDLDVYIRGGANEFVMFITGAGYEAVESYEQPTIAFTTHFYSNKLMYRFNSSIIGVYNFKNGKGRKVQMILINDGDDLTNYEFGQFIISTYDFTFLMNFYDGHNLYIHDYQGIVKKRGTISDFVIQRCTYRNDEGFQVGVLKSAIRSWYCATTATIIRCFKYEALGYKIDNIPSLSFVTQLNIDTDLD